MQKNVSLKVTTKTQQKKNAPSPIDKRLDPKVCVKKIADFSNLIFT